jgi:hypothetical protein
MSSHVLMNLSLELKSAHGWYNKVQLRWWGIVLQTYTLTNIYVGKYTINDYYSYKAIINYIYSLRITLPPFSSHWLGSNLKEAHYKPFEQWSDSQLRLDGRHPKRHIGLSSSMGLTLEDKLSALGSFQCHNILCWPH